MRGRALAALVLLLAAASAQAQTAGLWLFDAPDSPDAPAAPAAPDASAPRGAVGLQLPEAADPQLAFTKGNRYGTVAFVSDVPKVMASGRTALHCNAPRGLDVPAGDRFALAQSGEITIECWYKPRLADTVRAILSFGGGKPNGFGIAQRPPSDGKFAIEAVFTDDAGKNHTLRTAPRFAADSDWFHLAVVVHLPSGMAYLYVDGKVEAQATGWDRAVFKPASYPLRLGATSDDSFAGSFLIDELRISRKALPAGSGSGQDELAFAASLATPPQPAGQP